MKNSPKFKHFQRTNYISTKVIRLVLLTLFFITACSNGDINPPVQPEIGIAGDGNLAAHLEYIRYQNNLPALAAMTIHSGEIVEMEAVGLRAIGHPETVTVDDRWHLGSITKSMTSTLAAVLVEKGLISWETTVTEVFQDLVGTMRPEYADVRLDELLSHLSGLKTQITGLPDELLLADQRRKVTADVLTEAPAAERGTHHYSNTGYLVAGAMLEEVTGELWEELIKTHVFEPLGMHSTGFGAPGTTGLRDQPWGHTHSDFPNIWVALDPGDNTADNPALIGPAGTVHSPMHDFALYLAAHLAGEQGIDGLVTKESFAKLHTPSPGMYYALGWVVIDDHVWHDGSNGKWLAYAKITPAMDAAYFVVTNVAGDGVDQVTHQDVPQLLEARLVSNLAEN